jgi:gas vesicle protein
MSENKGFFRGVIIGGIVAGTAALLFAPKSGKETREDLKKRLDETQAELQAKINTAKKNGDANTKALIAKGEEMAAELARRSAELNKSGKKVGGVAAEETKVLTHQAAELAAELADSTKKVVKTGQKEAARIQRANERAKAKQATKKPTK